MTNPFLSEIRIMSFNFPPKGWALCDGQLLPINQNQALFSLLGTTYGGDGRVNFGLPNLQGRIPIHMGSGFTLGERAGETAHTIINSEMPAHNHLVNATGSIATTDDPSDGGLNDALLAAAGVNIYNGANSINTTLNPAAVTSVGGSQAHDNMSPYLTLSFCIALQGIFPSQT
jgi:microcystin-dependent protein